MTLIRTTIDPDRLIDVSPAELESLTRQRLIYIPGTELEVEWFTWSDGERFNITSVTISITDQADTVVLATTSAGVFHTVLGFGYRWLDSARPGPGTYTAHWQITTRNSTGDASQTFTITAVIGSGYSTGGYSTCGYSQ